MINFTGILLFVLLIGNTVQVYAANSVSLPKEYKTWEMSKDKAVVDKSSLFYGIHNIYVDAKAMKTYRSGGKYSEGSRFVVEQYVIKTENGNPVKGKKSMVVFMRKDKRMKITGGWLFAGFTPDGKASGLDPVKNCFECHARDAAATDFVISSFSDFR